MRRHSLLRLLSLLALTLVAISTRADEVRHRFLCCDYNGDQVCLVGADGKIEWRAEAKHPQDCWLLPDGNVLVVECGTSRLVEVHRAGNRRRDPRRDPPLRPGGHFRIRTLSS